MYGLPQTVPIPEEHATHPVCSYGAHKLAIEDYLDLYHHLYGLEYCVLGSPMPSASTSIPRRPKAR